MKFYLILGFVLFLNPVASGYAKAFSCDFQRGWTKDVVGGLGGRIIRVTNLNASGKGSLKAAVKEEGARVVVFEVSGNIDLKGKKLTVKNPYLTIAGQTAPSPGITILNGGIKIKSHDVVIQHLHVRPGARGKSKGWEPDGISLYPGHNVVIDHNSITWAVDENLSASGPRFDGDHPSDWQNNTSHNVTFSNNIIAEALDHATHSEGPHSKGSLIHDNVQKVLIYQNLYSSNRGRNPHFKGGTHGAVINNVITNPGNSIIRYAQHPGQWKDKEYLPGYMVIVGNTVFRGKDTSKYAKLLRVTGNLQAYLRDNIEFDQDMLSIQPVIDDYKEMREPPKLEKFVDIQPADQALKSLWNKVGARPWDRDEIDLRIIEQAKNGKTRMIDLEPEQRISRDPVARKQFDIEDWDQCMDRRLIKGSEPI